MGDFDNDLLTNRSGDHFLKKVSFSPVKILILRGEGDSNSRGRKTKGLAILRRAGLGHPRIFLWEIILSDKKVMQANLKPKPKTNIKICRIYYIFSWGTGQKIIDLRV